MAEFKRALSTSQIQPGKGLTVEVGGQQIAVFNVDGAFHAIANTCAHRGGPLGEGDVSGKEVTCPWHGWGFDVTSGCATHTAAQVKTYPVKVEGGDLYIGV